MLLIFLLSKSTEKEVHTQGLALPSANYEALRSLCYSRLSKHFVPFPP